MTVERTNDYTGPLLGNGVATNFPFDFHVASAEELSVQINGMLIDPSLYTVTIYADGTGFIVFVAPPVGTIYLFSDPVFTQEVNFEDQGPFYQSSVNEPIDRSALRDIWLRARAQRAFQVPFGEEGPVLPFADDRGGALLGFAPDGSVDLGVPVAGVQQWLGLTSPNTIVAVNNSGQPYTLPLSAVYNLIGTTIFDDGAWGGSYSSDGAWG